jgi:hypothetical protein
MRTALDANKKIVALTADVSSFYHELNPGFMLDPAFMAEVMGLELSEQPQAKLHRLFIQALTSLGSGHPFEERLARRAYQPLPSWPMWPWSNWIASSSSNWHRCTTAAMWTTSCWSWRTVPLPVHCRVVGMDFRPFRCGKLLGSRCQERKQIGFQPAYLRDSQIRFANAKNKVFMLADEPGKTLVDAIAHQIHERASEWRAMPRLPRSASHVGTDLLAATQSDGEAADNLRKADALTMRRAGFAIKLRDFEAYERDLPPGAWQAHRQAFFRAFVQHVLVLPQFFDLAVYLPRVIRLATVRGFRGPSQNPPGAGATLRPAYETLRAWNQSLPDRKCAAIYRNHGALAKADLHHRAGKHQRCFPAPAIERRQGGMASTHGRISADAGY